MIAKFESSSSYFGFKRQHLTQSSRGQAVVNPGSSLGQAGVELVNLGSSWGQAGVKLGSSWGQAGVKRGSSWVQPWVKLGSTRGQSGVQLGSTCTALPCHATAFCASRMSSSAMPLGPYSCAASRCAVAASTVYRRKFKL